MGEIDSRRRSVRNFYRYGEAGFSRAVAVLFSDSVEVNATLEDFQWSNRILLFSGMGGSERLLGKVLESLQEDALRERRLKVFVVGEKGVLEMSYNEDREKPAITKRQAMQVLGESDVVLLGLDGGVKGRYSLDVFSWDENASAIDAIPMRRAELRRQNH